MERKITKLPMTMRLINFFSTGNKVDNEKVYLFVLIFTVVLFFILFLIYW
jgi:hypothetical protein